MGLRVRAAARPRSLSLGPPAGLPFFATMPHRMEDVSLELDGPWADHSSFRNPSSSSESVSAVKVVFDTVSHGVLGGEGLASLATSGFEKALARARAERSKCPLAAEQAVPHRLDLSPLAREASKPQASQSLSCPGWPLPAPPTRQPLLPRPFRALGGRQEPHTREGLARGHGGHCTQLVGAWGGTRPKKGRAPVKLFSPRIPVCPGTGWHRQAHDDNHARAPQLPAQQHPKGASRWAIVKAVTPRKLANDGTTQGFPPTFSYRRAGLPAHCCWLPCLRPHRAGEVRVSKLSRERIPQLWGRGGATVKQAQLWPLRSPSQARIRWKKGLCSQKL